MIRLLPFFLIFISACGNNEKNLPKLSTEQKQDFVQVTQALLRPAKAVDQKKAKEKKTDKDAVINKMSDELRDCLVTENKNGLEEVVEFSGPQCPIKYRAHNSGQVTGNNSGTIRSEISYQVVSEEFKNLNDVIRLDMVQNISLGGGNDRLSVNMSGSGSATSQKNGTLNFNMEISLASDKDKSDLRMVLRMTLGKFEAEMVAVSSRRGSQQTQEITINGEKIDPNSLPLQSGR